MRKALAVLACLVAAGGLAACDEEEQNRPLSFTGSYQGPRKPALGADKLDQLARRVEFQRGLATTATPTGPRPAAGIRPGGSPWGAGANVRVTPTD